MTNVSVRKADGKDGTCVFCDKRVTVAEYRKAHYGGKCQDADSGADVAKAVRDAVTETDEQRYTRLSKSVGDHELARFYRDKARQAAARLGEGRK